MLLFRFTVLFAHLIVFSMEGSPGPLVVKFADTDKQKKDRAQQQNLQQQQLMLQQMYNLYAQTMQVSFAALSSVLACRACILLFCSLHNVHVCMCARAHVRVVFLVVLTLMSLLLFVCLSLLLFNNYL